MTASIVDAKDDCLWIHGKKVLDFAPYVTEVKQITTSKGEKREYRIQIHRNGEVIKEAWLSKLYVNSWFDLSAHCPDAGLTSKERRLIEGYMQKQAAELPCHKEILLDKKGWSSVGSGCIFFNEMVITKAVPDIVKTKEVTKMVEVENYRFHTDGVRNILCEIQRAAESLSWIVYITSFFDILKYPFEMAGYPIEFVINVYGKSGFGKTSLIKTICSPSNIFSFSQPQRSDAVLREIKRLGGHTILMDDYHPAENKYTYERQNSLKDRLVRLVEEDSNAPNILISSEELGGHVSMQDREVQLFLEKPVNWEPLAFLNSRQEALREIRTAFFVQIVANREAVIDKIRSFCAMADRKRISDGQTSLRCSRYLDYIRCASYLFQVFFCQAYGINFQYTDIENDTLIHQKRQSRHMEILKGWEQHGTHLITLRNMLRAPELLKNIPNGKEFRASADTIHVDSAKRLYIAPKALQLGMIRYLQTSRIPMKQIIQELKTADVLITYNKGNEFTKKINGERCYIINLDALDEYCSFFE